MVIPRFSQCDLLPLERLFDVDDEVSDTSLSAHVETCTRCQQRLETLAADQQWWNAASELLSHADGTATGLLMTGDSGHSTDSRALSSAETSFLQTTDRNDALGRLGPYDILELIGRGGMAIVFKGYESALNRYVAVKVLAPHLADSGAARKRFQREAESAAAVIHEHVIAIHAIDATAEGLPYLVMPLVLGGSLQRRIDHQGPLELRDMLRIGMQAATGLAAAHAQGLVHRDVKPANILLDGGASRGLLTDFGLARAADDASLTRSGVIAGTPHYMAPEQVLAGPIDARADLFSLGGVLFAMATGRPPFRAEITMAVLRRICEDAPRSICEINPDLPKWFEAIVMKLLAKQPSDRFQSASEVAELLAGCLAHVQQPSAIALPDEVTRLTVRVRAPLTLRRRLTWGLAGLAAVAVGLAGWMVFSPTDDVARNAGQQTHVPSSTEPSAGAPLHSAITEDMSASVPEADLQWDDPLGDELVAIRHQLDRWVATAPDLVTGGAASPTVTGPSLDKLRRQIEQLEQDTVTTSLDDAGTSPERP